MRAKVLLSPKQKKEIDLLLKQSKFDRLCSKIINNKSYSVDDRAKLILELKKRIFIN